MFTTLFLILIVILVWLFFAYNKLRRLAENVKQKQSNIYATIKKRHDIAQRLSDIASNYGDHEKLTHLTITESDSIAKANIAVSEASHLIGNVQMLANRFPDLKANSTYQQLMVQLDKIENTILERREAYNAAVQIYNSLRGSIPHLFYATKLGFVEATYFEMDENGMDQLASFNTDDGKILRDTMGRMASVATENIKKIKNKKNDNADIDSPDNQ
ncbi:LemA family protein [Gilliamella apicola]|uniref:LemA family protein n=1 Tax=Gilliamella apicola TaxID=1196095 RepID=UPI00042F27A5|nr:LemA family protein [Gilliamella apicola]AHN26869.1 LemA family protein [Gilliamella apicola]PXV93966.1 LemA protein [Gilliamella apicola]